MPNPSLLAPRGNLWMLLLLSTLACESASERPEPSATAGHPSDCGVLEKRICEATSQPSPECEAAGILVSTMPSAACATSLSQFASMKDGLVARRKPCVEFANAVCGELGAESEGCQSARKQTETFLGSYCETKLRPRLAQVVSDLRKQEAAKRPLDAAQQAQIADAEAPSLGPANAKVTVVSFSDFQCPFCANAASTLKRLHEKYPKDVRFVFRNFPLGNHPQAKPAAMAALAAHAQGKFWEMHDELFANQHDLSDAALERYARAVGLNLPAFRETLASGRLDNHLTGDQAMGALIGVGGTPTVYINGQLFDRMNDFEAASRHIDALLGGS